ncbi:E3 ubiquitin-protein ligase DZIP3 [Elysia marginata]|uniref:E3 ubiquitin-protein ligase DZIP3 n=1 Tax=Elysia marginata TaxID=1093978 RepID=A0AAV4H0R3_9GAST|nr:E3 ubiquitin-protein ligase DZIP3 [Elysia marginata]
MELPAIPETDPKTEVISNGHTLPDGDSLVTTREREALGRVCWLLHEAGTLALRTTFDSIHPPLYLPEHLQHMHVKSLLQRLRQQDIISEVQWRQLYPPRKRKKKFTVTSQKFDTKVLVVMLQTCCHLSPPYPHGWHVAPLPTDSSLSADIVRLQLKLQEVGALGGLRKEEHPVVWQQAVHILQNLGNQEVKVKIQRIEKEALPSELSSKYIALIKQAWAPAESQVSLSS